MGNQRVPGQLNTWLAGAMLVLAACVLLTGGATAYLWWQRPAASAPITGDSPTVDNAPQQGGSVLDAVKLNPAKDRRQVALCAGSFEDQDLWLADLAGGKRQQLTSTPEGEFYPAWSPDGTKLAFARTIINTTGPKTSWERTEGIFWINFAGQEPREERLAEATITGLGPVSWSPDGKYIAFTSPKDPGKPDSFEAQFVTIEARTKNIEITPLPFRPLGAAPSWSSGGNSVVVVGQTKDKDANTPTSAAYVLSQAGLLSTIPDVQAAAFSPAEPLIACLKSSHQEIDLVKPDGSQARTIRWEHPISTLAWSPDGQTLAIADMPTDQHYRLVLYTLADDSSTVYPVEDYHYPSYLSWSPDGHYLAYGCFTPWTNEKRPTARIEVIDVAAGAASAAVPFAQEQDLETMLSWRLGAPQ